MAANLEKIVRDIFRKSDIPETGRVLVLDVIQRARKGETCMGEAGTRGLRQTLKAGPQYFDDIRGDGCRLVTLDQRSNVIEFFGYPCQCNLSHKDADGKPTGKSIYRPRFMVVSENEIWFEDVRADHELVKAAAKGTQFAKIEGQWVYRSATEYFKARGLQHRILPTSSIPMILVQNTVFLEDFAKAPPLSDESLDKIRQWIGAERSFPFKKAIQDEIFTASDLFQGLLAGAVYVDLELEPVYVPTDLILYSDAATAKAGRLARQSEVEEILPLPGNSRIEIGSKVMFDSVEYHVVLCGVHEALLRDADGHQRALSMDVLEAANTANAITTLPAPKNYLKELSQCSPEELARAVARLEALRQWDTEKFSERSLLDFQRRTCLCRNDHERYVALLDRKRETGNRLARLPKRVEEIAAEVIKKFYNTPTNRTASGTYNKYIEMIKLEEKATGYLLEPMSYTTFTRRCKDLRSICARQGKRVRYQKSPIAQLLDQRYPVHGLLPHTAVHFDHTTAIMATIDINGVDLGKPTVSVGFDACTRHARALVVSYDGESKKLVLLMLRDYVRRWKRLPRAVILDNGSAFHSAELESFCAEYGIDIIWRKSGEPRDGSIVERGLEAIEQEVFQQQEGNTSQMRDNRLMTKQVDPFLRAEHTCMSLWGSIDKYLFTIKPDHINPSLGMSPNNFEKQLLETAGNRCAFNFQTLNGDLMLATSPHADKPFHSLCTRRGIWVDNAWYWHPEFRTQKPKIKLRVRVEPWMASVIYVRLKMHWVVAVSTNLLAYKGRTRREMNVEERAAKRKALRLSTKDLRSPEYRIKMAELARPSQFDERIAAQEREALYAARQFGLAEALPQKIEEALLAYEPEPLELKPVMAQEVAGTSTPSATPTSHTVQVDDQPEYADFTEGDDDGFL